MIQDFRGAVKRSNGLFGAKISENGRFEAKIPEKWQANGRGAFHRGKKRV